MRKKKLQIELWRMVSFWFGNHESEERLKETENRDDCRAAKPLSAVWKIILQLNIIFIIISILILSDILYWSHGPRPISPYNAIWVLRRYGTLLSLNFVNKI